MTRPRRRPAILVNHLKGGGKEQFVVTLANALHRRGHQPLVVCLEEGGRLAAALSEGVRCVALHKGRGNNLRLPLSIAREARAWGADVLHSNNWGTLVESVVSSTLLGDCPVLHTQHGLDYEKLGARRRSRLRLLAKRLVSRRVGQHVTVNDEVRQVLIDEWHLPPDRVRVIFNGVVLPSDTARSRHAREAARAALGLDAGAFVVGTVGYLRPVKAYPVLVEACAHLLRSVPHAHLVLVGAGPSRGEIEAAAARCGIASRVHLLGARPDVPALLCGFDVFALSSVSEGISLAILEAMAAELPVVVTRVGGNAHVVGDSGGVLVPPNDAQALAAALARFATDEALRARIGQAGRARVVQHFSDDRMAADYEAAYDGL